jgi:type IV pilus assembly protein PilB
VNSGSATAAPEVAPGLVPPSGRLDAQRRLGDVIVELGFADREAVEAAIESARETGHRLGQALVESGAVDSAQLARALAERNGLPFVDVNQFEVDHGAANLISATQARRYRAIPIAFADERTLLTATSDPANLMAIDDIAMATGYDVKLAVTSPEHVEALIGQLSHLADSVHEVEEETQEAEPAAVIELLESAEQAPVVKLVHSVVAEAVERGASDIHFDPRDGDMRVRFRVDGVVTDSTTVPKRLVSGLISRVKIMAELDIAERRLPQDGRVGLTVDGRYIDVRVATLPVMRGESVVMRILDKDRVVMDLDHLGMQSDDRSRLEHSITKVHGAVLVTGPTGAGKTTTLYAAMNEVNSPDKTLIAIEDPVEYELDGVKQVQVNPKTGLSFAAGLRSMIRSDPDVMMVGEIRDRETAQIAIESALTGHLVLSTLHTNDAPMAVARLIEMGIEPFLVASGIECIVAQRLARRLCDDCKQPVAVSAEELSQNGFDGDGFEAFEPVGCVSCKSTGYRGRIGLYEVMEISPEVRSLILGSHSTAEIGEAAAAAGMRRLRDDGLEKARQGITSLPEVLRVLGA